MLLIMNQCNNPFSDYFAMVTFVLRYLNSLDFFDDSIFQKMYIFRYIPESKGKSQHEKEIGFIS